MCCSSDISQVKDSSIGMLRSGAPSSNVPTLYWAKKIGGMVTGLVSQTRLTEIGRLERATMATAAATAICIGIGIPGQAVDGILVYGSVTVIIFTVAVLGCSRVLTDILVVTVVAV